MPLLIVELVTVGPPAELAAEEAVADPRSCKRLLKRLAVEAGSKAAIRMGADVDDHVDRWPTKEINEVVDRLVRVANREDRAFHLAHGTDDSQSTRRGGH